MFDKIYTQQDLAKVAVLAAQLAKITHTLVLPTVTVDFDKHNLRFWISGEDEDGRLYTVSGCQGAL